MAVRVQQPDGSIETRLEAQPPDLAALRSRIAKILEREGEKLRAGNLLLRAHLLTRKAQDQLSLERDRRAEDVVEKFQWITAGTVFANPFPALELVANGAVQLQMISELAGVYGVQISTLARSDDRRPDGADALEARAGRDGDFARRGHLQVIAGGLRGGGGRPGRLDGLPDPRFGEAFSEYFRQGQTWGDGGMQAALVRQFDLTSRAEFLQDFAKQAMQKVSTRFLQGSRKTPERPATKT